MHTPDSPNTRGIPGAARHTRLRRSIVAVWCATALCVAASACSGPSSPTTSSAESDATASEGDSASSGTDSAESDATAAEGESTSAGAGSSGGEPPEAARRESASAGAGTGGGEPPEAAGSDSASAGAGTGGDEPSSADAAWAYAEALAAAGWSEEVVVEAEARAAALEDEGSSGEFVPVPPKPSVQVLAFGSLHSDGTIEPEPLGGVTVVAVPSRRWGDWWTALTGLDFGDDQLPGIFHDLIRLPRGAQYHGDTQRALRTPEVAVATTDADGTAELWLRPVRRYHVCVLPPETEGFVAGCEFGFRADSYHDPSYSGGLVTINGTAMVYFSHGRAYLGVDRDHGDHRGRFWYQRIAEGMFGDLSAPAPGGFMPKPKQGQATVEFYSQQHNKPDGGDAMALIADSQVGAWWDSINSATLDEWRGIDRAAVESSPAMLVRLEPDPAANKYLLAAVTVEAGAYLVCWLPLWSRRDFVLIDFCVYEEFPADSRNYLDLATIEVQNSLERLDRPRAPG